MWCSRTGVVCSGGNDIFDAGLGREQRVGKAVGGGGAELGVQDVAPVVDGAGMCCACEQVALCGGIPCIRRSAMHILRFWKKAWLGSSILGYNYTESTSIIVHRPQPSVS